jgi:hypothetical protein
VGYRFTHRKVDLWGLVFDFDPLVSGTSDVSSSSSDESDNTTHTLIAGVRIKPTQNWSIFGDIEHGSTDNFFTRLGNNDLTNYRIRSVANFSTVTFNVSAISKKNEVPGRSIDPTRNGLNEVRNRIFSASVDWTPRQEFTLSGGYTFQHLTSITDIRVPLDAGVLDGISEYYVRDSYYFIDAHLNFKRVSFFGSYRFDDDNGQGNRPIPPASSPNIITSYPMQMHSPEFRVAVKLTRNIDWNFGYQYFKYEDVFTPVQNYNAHLPYTSVRFYFGQSSDR